MTDPDINELEALHTLVQSDGWTVFKAHVDREYGPEACIRQIDTALATVERGDRDAAEETVTQIRARAKAAQALASWPEQRIKYLKDQQKAGKGVLAGLGMRRV